MRRGIQRGKHAIEHRGVACCLGQFTPGEPLEPIDSALWNGRKRERHDVVERHDDAHRPAATFAPAPERSATHWIERTPSTARHSAGRISRSCSIRTECSAAAMSRRQ